MVIVGNTLLIRDYVLEELKLTHNLIIQRVSMTQRRNTALFKNSILEGTQSSISYGQNFGNSGTANSIFEAYFSRATAANSSANV